MAKFQLLVIAALCLALVGIAFATPQFSIEGRIYCDTCRAGFETSLTTYIEGAKVKLECRRFDTNKMEYTTEGVTDSTGTYKLQVHDSHEEDICEVVLLNSPIKDCSQIEVGRDRSRIVLSYDSGMTNAVRHANSLGFLKDEPLQDCGLLLQQYALGADE